MRAAEGTEEVLPQDSEEEKIKKLIHERGKTEKMKESVPESAGKTEKRELWRDFTETFKDSDAFLYSRLQSWPYQEDDKSVSVTITATLASDGNDFSERLKSLFDNFAKGRKEFSVSFEKGENRSIFTEDELQRMEEIEKRKKNMAESGSVKAALQMGFEIKGVFAE